MTTPLETNARKLIGVLLQYFPTGGTCEDLRRAFEKDTGLKRQSFYYALNYAKAEAQRWIVGGGSPHNQNQLYHLNPDGSWKEPAASTGEGGIGEGLDKGQQIGELQDEVERLLGWGGGSDGNGRGVGLSSLVRIVGDSAASTRQRIKASAAVLAYQVQDTEITEFVKRYLQSVCTSADIANVDYRIEAGELLRKHEAPRIGSDIVKPNYSNDGTGAQRTEAWRVYERWQLRKQIVLETRDPPKPGWDDHLQRDTYAGPPEGHSMPPVQVVEDAASGFRLLDNLLPKTAYHVGNGNGDTSAS